MKLRNILMLVVTGLFMSCNDYLELQPQQSLHLSTSYGTAADIRTALVGTYNRFQNDHLFGGDIVLSGDLMSANINWQGSFTGPTEINQLSITTVNANVDGMYAMLYRLVNNANSIIEALPNIDDMDQAEKDQVMGEVLFMRGAAYFEVVRYFSKDFVRSES